MCSHHFRMGSGFCGLPTGRMQGFMQPWLLLLLRNRPAHGYQLLDRLNQNEDTRGIDPGFLYRTLRQFEEERLVKSSWDMEGPGAARRVYEITSDGIEYLRAWVEHIRNTRERLGRLLDTYESNSNTLTTREGGERYV